MHGREDGENRKRIRHMWSVASRGSAVTVGVDSGSSSSVNSFLKDGRKITVGDCALFKPPNDSPPFIGFIRSLSLDKDNNLKLRVNWLYRPAEVVLGKGVVLEAAPNEVFYSFHRDETLAASLLHPCKVAFLPKGVELPSGVSSFVCRRVYDITNKCLWWLRDKDYINDRQEEVDQLLQKSRSEMHPSVHQHQGTNSPKSVNGVAATSPLEHSPDSMQNNGTYTSHPKGKKKRDLGDQTLEPMKRERPMKDGDSVLLRSESSLKSELTKITDKGGLIDYESVEKLVQLMQSEKLQKKVDFSCRSMLAGIIACTDRFDCLNEFVLLRGLPVLDEWLREVHKGKVGDSGSPKDSDKSVEDFLFVLLSALDKLPVNLNALQTCNIGKSVNNLRSHKNLEIQKKARSLVDTWKKRVELEMNMNDAKPTAYQNVPWPGRPRHDVSHGGNKRASESSDVALRSSAQLASTKSGPLKPVHGDTTSRSASASIATQKTAVSMSVITESKDGQVRISSTGVGSELPHTAVKEEKSSSSSQSHTNSQCSSDLARNIARSGKEDARCSTAGSKSMNKPTGSSRNRKSTNGPQALAHSGMQKELGSNRNSSLPSISPSDKFSESTISSGNNGAGPVAESNSHKIIVKIPNRGRSPGQVANTASTDDSSCKNIGASSPAHSEKPDQANVGLMEKKNSLLTNDVDMFPAALSDEKQYTLGNIVANVPGVSKGVSQSTETDSSTKRSVDSSMSSINALNYICVQYSISVGDDSGMNLLASVATGEITRSGASSPEGSPRNTAVPSNGSVGDEGPTLCNDGEPSKPSMSNEDPQQNGDPFSKTNGQLDECSGGTSFSVSTACIAGKSDVGGGEQIQSKAEVIQEESHDSVSCKKLIANNCSSSQDETKGGIQCKELLNKDQEDSLVHLSSNCDDKNNPDQGQNNNVSIDHKPNSSATHPWTANKDKGQVVDSACIRGETDLEHYAEQITETTLELETCSSVPDGRNKRIKLDKTATLCPDGEELSMLASAGLEEKDEPKSDILGRKERKVESHLSSKKIATTDVQDRKEECISRIVNATSSPAVDSETDKKLEFDLNEGFDMDDLKNGEPTTMVSTVFPAPVSLFGASQSAISLASSSLPASVTVASAAKRPFVPLEDLLRNKSELGWKGSAATSAFRPAEPRKVLDNQSVSSKAPLKEPMPSKSVRAFLDIDLNVTVEMVLGDMGCQDSAKDMDHNRDRKSGGLELDLNKLDDSSESGHRSAAGNFQRFEVLLPPVQSSNNTVNGHISTKRNFDLNDGPAVDESTVDSSPYNLHGRVNIPPQPTFGMRMNNSALGSLSSWYSPGTTYSAITTPVALPDISILGGPGPQNRAMSAPTTASPFNADFYRGSVLSSSPAMPFGSTPFQYPAVFPFGTSFPLPTSSLSGGSAAYMDPSNGGRFCTLAVPTQFVGAAGSVSNQYLRPCVVSLPDVNSNGVVESSQKWGRHGLDLNSGPLGVEADGKDEALHIASRQLPAVNPQALMDDQASRGYQLSNGVLKRKEPDGGWDRLSYKQPSWQ